MTFVNMKKSLQNDAALNLNGRCSRLQLQLKRRAMHSQCALDKTRLYRQPSLFFAPFFILLHTHTHITLQPRPLFDFFPPVSTRSPRGFFPVFLLSAIEFSGDDYRNLSFRVCARRRSYKFNIGLCRRTRFLFIYCVCVWFRLIFLSSAFVRRCTSDRRSRFQFGGIFAFSNADSFDVDDLVAELSRGLYFFIENIRVNVMCVFV